MEIAEKQQEAEEKKKEQAQTQAEKSAEKAEEKTQGAIEAEQLAERARQEAELQAGQEAGQPGEKTPGAIEAEQIAERAKLAQESQKQREQQQKQQKERQEKAEAQKAEHRQAQEIAAAKLHFSIIERVKAMRAEDEKLIAQEKEAMREKADLQAHVEKGEKSGPKLELERGGDERKPELTRERERENEKFAGDLRGLNTSFSSGFEQLSRSVQMSGFVPERARAGAGSEHLNMYNGSKQPQAAPEAQPGQPTAEQAQTKIEQYDPRFGAEAIEGTQAYKDRDEADAERGRGYRELPADQMTTERVREDDGYSDRVPKSPEPDIADDYDDDYGR